MGKCACTALPRWLDLIAAAIFQVEADKAGSYEILDALSELIHIVGGNLKALLPQPVILSLPSLPESHGLGADHAAMANGLPADADE